MPTDAEVTLRPATPDDAGPMADLHVDSREANLGSMPPMVHSRETTHAWMARRLQEGVTAWLAEQAGAPLGYLVLGEAWLDDLFVRPGEEGHGVGLAMLDLAKALRPDGFCLWVFASNHGARRFYARHGLVELETTDGAENVERSPDVRMAWPGASPVAFYRGLIDDIDLQVADLLTRRVALTGAVQPHKAGQERDPDREREIVRAMSTRAPALGEERLTRIVHAIISESLDAVD